MANTYTWKIYAVGRNTALGDLENVVKTVKWELTGTSEDGHVGRFHGNSTLNFNPDNEFIPFEQLSEEQIIGWIESHLDETEMAAYKRAVDLEIERQANPVDDHVIEGWIKPATESVTESEKDEELPHFPV